MSSSMMEENRTPPPSAALPPPDDNDDDNIDDCDDAPSSDRDGAAAAAEDDEEDGVVVDDEDDDGGSRGEEDDDDGDVDLVDGRRDRSRDQNDDDDRASSSSSSSPSEEEEEVVEEEEDGAGRPLRLGGPIVGVDDAALLPAYALLGGIRIDHHRRDGGGGGTGVVPSEVISIPIRRLPVTLGRRRRGAIDGGPSFIGLGDIVDDENDDENDAPAAGSSSSSSSAKTSSSMCCIYYRDGYGGRVGMYEPDGVVGGAVDDADGGDHPFDGMVYKPARHDGPVVDVDEGDDDTVPTTTSLLAPPSSSPDYDVLRLPGMDPNAPLPPEGFFAIECTCGGREIITVGGRVLRKGESAMLACGTPIGIASYRLYFLLPKDDPSRPPLTMKVGVVTSPPIEPEIVTSRVTHGSSSSSSPPLPLPPSKKARKSHEGHDGMTPPRPSATATTTTATTTTTTPTMMTTTTTAFNDMTDVELMSLLSRTVIETSTWDYECQKLGSALAVRACRAAANSAAVRRIARDSGAVTLREVLDWMNNAAAADDDDGGGPRSVFGEYEPTMLRFIEKKSFMMSMLKALARAGYTKNEFLSGRAIRWNLPEDGGGGDDVT